MPHVPLLATLLEGVAVLAVAAALGRSALVAAGRAAGPGWAARFAHAPAEWLYCAAAAAGLLGAVLGADAPLGERLYPALLAWFGGSAADYLLGRGRGCARPAVLAIAAAVLCLAALPA